MVKSGIFGEGAGDILLFHETVRYLARVDVASQNRTVTSYVAGIDGVTRNGNQDGGEVAGRIALEGSGECPLL